MSFRRRLGSYLFAATAPVGSKPSARSGRCTAARFSSWPPAYRITRSGWMPLRLGRMITSARPWTHSSSDGCCGGRLRPGQPKPSARKWHPNSYGRPTLRRTSLSDCGSTRSRSRHRRARNSSGTSIFRKSQNVSGRRRQGGRGSGQIARREPSPMGYRGRRSYKRCRPGCATARVGAVEKRARFV